MKKAGIFLITLALIAGMAGCGLEQDIPHLKPEEYFQLTICTTKGGEVTTPGRGPFRYNKVTVVDLVAEAEEGYHFVVWTGDVDTVADVEKATTTITMNDHYSICANFALMKNPLEIRDWYDLDAIRCSLGGNYTLMNDLDSTTPGYQDLAGPTANQGKGWQPIGDWDRDPFVDIYYLYLPFTGSFDGQGYGIRDLFISRPGTDGVGVGLFGFVDGGVVENLGLVNAEVTGHVYVGSLVGENRGTVRNSYSTSSVTGEDVGGGLVGWNKGTVSNSYSSGNVAGNGSVGGLVGRNAGTVSNSYSTSSVTGDENVGGLVGLNEEGIVSNSFWDTETSGQSTSADGTGKITAEMKSITTFTGATWDIIAVVDPGTRNPSYIWNIVDGQTYPFLSWQSVS